MLFILHHYTLESLLCLVVPSHSGIFFLTFSGWAAGFAFFSHRVSQLVSSTDYCLWVLFNLVLLFHALRRTEDACSVYEIYTL